MAVAHDLESVDFAGIPWRRSRRPVRGVLLHYSLAGTLALAGLVAPPLGLKVTFLVAAVFVAVSLRWWTDRWLEKRAAELAKTTRSNATKVLAGLEDHWLVASFAPHAWVQLERGRLHMRLTDGRAAARSFSEAARLIGSNENAALQGLQAAGLTLSGDIKAARPLLVDLERRGALSPRDRLNLGIAYVEEPGKVARAVELAEEARAALGEHPRVLAALALALVRAGQVERSQEAVEGIDEVALVSDPLAAVLAKRARKDLRQKQERHAPRGKRKAGAAQPRQRQDRKRRKDEASLDAVIEGSEAEDLDRAAAPADATPSSPSDDRLSSEMPDVAASAANDPAEPDESSSVSSSESLIDDPESLEDDLRRAQAIAEAMRQRQLEEDEDSIRGLKSDPGWHGSSNVQRGRDEAVGREAVHASAPSGGLGLRRAVDDNLPVNAMRTPVGIAPFVPPPVARGEDKLPVSGVKTPVGMAPFVPPPVARGEDKLPVSGVKTPVGMTAFAPPSAKSAAPSEPSRRPEPPQVSAPPRVSPKPEPPRSQPTAKTAPAPSPSKPGPSPSPSQSSPASTELPRAQPKPPRLDAPAVDNGPGGDPWASFLGGSEDSGPSPKRS